VETEVYSIEQVGKMLGLGRNGAYEAARSGQIPVIRIGRLLKVPKVAFDRMLERASEPNGLKG
jgi:excisionase family DNA binding protein